MNNIKVPYNIWEEIGNRYYGQDKTKWEFICPTCNRTFSAAIIVYRNPQVLVQYHLKSPDHVLQQITCRCGWYFLDQSCDWSLYGLFHSENVFVIQDGNLIRCFFFADPKANIELQSHDMTAQLQKQLQEIEVKSQALSWEKFAWDAWVPTEIRKQIIDFWHPSWQRNPSAWFHDFRECEPMYGTVVTKNDLCGAEVHGKYIHKCNNIGFVVREDGTFAYVSS